MRRWDRLFSVGDLVNRGSESEQVLGWLAKPWFMQSGNPGNAEGGVRTES